MDERTIQISTTRGMIPICVDLFRKASAAYKSADPMNNHDEWTDLIVAARVLSINLVEIFDDAERKAVDD